MSAELRSTLVRHCWLLPAFLLLPSEVCAVGLIGFGLANGFGLLGDEHGPILRAASYHGFLATGLMVLRVGVASL